MPPFQTRPVSTCPACESNSQTQRISGLLDGGTSATHGTGVTTGVGVGAGGVGVGLGHTAFNSATMTHLVQRFQRPGPPSSLRALLWVVGVVGYFVSWSVLERVPFVVDLPGGLLLPSLAGGVAAAVLLSRALRPRRLARLAAWQDCEVRLREGYYCLRDDVCFMPGDRFVASPEEFTANAFRHY